MAGLSDREGVSMAYTPGMRLRSVVCLTEAVVVRAPSDEIVLSCGGHPMVAAAAPTPLTGGPVVGAASGTQLGKRYVDDDLGVELLCVKAGAGSLAANGSALQIKDAKPLPSSD